MIGDSIACTHFVPLESPASHSLVSCSNRRLANGLWSIESDVWPDGILQVALQPQANCKGKDRERSSQSQVNTRYQQITNRVFSLLFGSFASSDDNHTLKTCPSRSITNPYKVLKTNELIFFFQFNLPVCFYSLSLLIATRSVPISNIF